VPAGVPDLLLLVVQVDEPAGDEGVDPGAGVGVSVKGRGWWLACWAFEESNGVG